MDEMMERPYTDTTTLIIVANEFPEEEFRMRHRSGKQGQFLQEIYLRWEDLFRILPAAKEVDWPSMIDFPDAEMFYNTMRMVVESDATPDDLYEDIVAETDGITFRWQEFLKHVPAADSVDWLKAEAR